MSRLMANAIGSALCLLFCVLGSSVGRAQQYPDRPIKLVVPFGAGGITDQTARVIGEELGKALKQNVIIENRPGASGSLAASQVARSTPDGYTLLILTNGIAAVNPRLQDKVSYDALKDFEFVSMVAFTPLIFVTDPRSAFDSLPALFAAARDKPDTLTFSSSGTGASIHQAMMLLKNDNGVAFLHVPFRSGAEAITAVLTGTVQATAVEAVVAEPFIKAGTLRALALSAKNRIPALPAVPTVKEAAEIDLEAGSLSGIVVPKGTPPAVLAKLHQALTMAVESDLARDRVYSLGSQRVPSSSIAFRETIAKEIDKWKSITVER